jgi:SAM-dependent methyltransferase
VRLPAGAVDGRSSAPARPRPGTLSPAVRGLLDTFIPAGSRCLNVGHRDGMLRPWLLDRGCRHVDVDPAQAAALPFVDESFDAALLLGALDRLVEPQLAAAELRRVLRPGGVLLVTADNLSYWRRRLDRTTRASAPPAGGVRPGWLRGLLLQAGFSLVGVEGQDGAFVGDLPVAGRLWRRRGSAAYRLAERFLPSLLGSRVGAFAIRV